MATLPALPPDLAAAAHQATARPACDVYLAPEADADDLKTVWRPVCDVHDWSDDATYTDPDEALDASREAHYIATKAAC